MNKKDNHFYGWVNRSFLKAALFYCQEIINGMMLDLDDKMNQANTEHHSHDEFFKKNCFKPEYRLSNNLKEILYVYSQLQLPFTQRDVEHSGGLNSESPMHMSRNTYT